eukprot:TRINITY_DN4530_c0_g1_i1.p1 TRINITY_DN4530_c0_g1~~TRINITY_DN4530_c0_g1_i1.p1  ORF type:complete len:1308 (+),score=298.54 TRINITY_DN4530_c0_g1_i1:48-3926(+)
MQNSNSKLVVLNGETYQRVSRGSGDSVVKLSINGQQYTADIDKDAQLGTMSTLNEFIRTKTGLTGTKRSCGEGGCGSCIVVMTKATGETHAVNSCLRPLLSCNGMAFTTTEGIGNSTKGYHPIQTGCAAEGGSQCGFCSPGFTMSMYGLLQEKKGKTPSKQEIEEALRGNICRCTGFRPIIQADQKFAENGENAEMSHLTVPSTPRMPTPMAVEDSTAQWTDITTEAQLKTMLENYSKQTPPPKDLMLVCGRTSQGIWKDRQPDVMLNIEGIPTLKTIAKTSNGYEIGSGATIKSVLEYLASQTGPDAAHLQQIHDHYLKVAAASIRNVASIGGNIMLTHLHQSNGDNFAYSDVTTVLVGYGAVLNIQDPDKDDIVSVDFHSFYAKDMTYSYLVSITLPFAKPNEVFRSYRIAARNALSHPFAVGSMKCTLNGNTVSTTQPVLIALGGIDVHPKVQSLTSSAMRGMVVTDLGAFKALCATLTNEAIPTPEEGRVPFRSRVVVNFLYKYFLALQPSLPASLKSGAQSWFTRQPVTANQTFDTDPSMYPVTKPEPKIAALKQCAGEAKYSGDVPEPVGTLHVAPILATQVGTFTGIVTDAAEALPGWKGMFSSADMDEVDNRGLLQGPLFAFNNKTEYIDQIICVVLGDTAAHATACAKAVVVQWGATQPPLVDLDEAIANKSFFPAVDVLPQRIERGNVKKAFEACDKVTTGQFKMKEQYHFHLETQTCLATHTPDGIGLKMYSATQAPSYAVTQVETVCGGLTAADISVETLRCGGSYGGKSFNAYRVAALTSVIAKKYRSPAKTVLEIDDNMKSMGMRCPWRCDYKVGYNIDGTIQAIEATYYVEAGNANTEVSNGSKGLMTAFDNCYNIPNWDVNIKFVKTQVPANTTARGPGFIPGIHFMEQFISEVAAGTSLTEDAVRGKNYYNAGDETPYGDKLTYFGNMKTILQRLSKSSDFGARMKQVDTWNSQNKWIKRGISLTPVKYAMDWIHLFGVLAGGFKTMVAVKPDGSVQVTTSGVEMGQGLATKVAEVVAYSLGCPEGMIRLQPTDTNVVGDIASLTGYSTSSELCCLAAQNSCAKINEHLAPVKKSLPAGATWQQIVAQGTKMGVKMEAKENDDNKPPKVKGDQYQSYSAVVHEVELDVLTGEVSVLRSDMLLDAGRSINPLIDIGQLEGGYLMGLGYALTEDLYRDHDSGLRKDVHNTWEYHVPSAADIPQAWNSGLMKGTTNPNGILGTKATAEPPVALGVSICKAVNQAVSAARGAAYVSPSLPFPVDSRMMACDVTYDQFVF